MPDLVQYDRPFQQGQRGLELVLFRKDHGGVQQCSRRLRARRTRLLHLLNKVLWVFLERTCQFGEPFPLPAVLAVLCAAACRFFVLVCHIWSSCAALPRLNARTGQLTRGKRDRAPHVRLVEPAYDGGCLKYPLRDGQLIEVKAVRKLERELGPVDVIRGRCQLFGRQIVARGGKRPQGQFRRIDATSKKAYRERTEHLAPALLVHELLSKLFSWNESLDQFLLVDGITGIVQMTVPRSQHESEVAGRARVVSGHLVTTKRHGKISAAITGSCCVDTMAQDVPELIGLAGDGLDASDI